MITVHYRHEGKIEHVVVEAGEPFPKGALWVDLDHPTPEEAHFAEQQLGITVPTREEIWKNEVLNRFYEQNHIAYMTTAIITKVDSPYPQTSAVTFILAERFLATIRSINPTSFTHFTQRIAKNPHDFEDGNTVLEGLLEEIITRVAHNSEIVVHELDRISHDIFDLREERAEKQVGSRSQMMRDVLKRLGTCADLNSKISESLHSISRMLCYFEDRQEHSKTLSHAIKILQTDIHALTQQTSFLSDKITFLLDATLGMISVEQNVIIKIFSVVAVFFMPPTLISSIYGMNFQHIPELQWMVGYPWALTLMFIAAITPYIYFRRKGWL